MCGLDVDHEVPDRHTDRRRDLVLEAGELDEVSVGLLAEVQGVRVDDELEGAAREPEVEQRKNGM
jgi:hypothetical protein